MGPFKSSTVLFILCIGAGAATVRSFQSSASQNAVTVNRSLSAASATDSKEITPTQKFTDEQTISHALIQSQPSTLSSESAPESSAVTTDVKPEDKKEENKTEEEAQGELLVADPQAPLFTYNRNSDGMRSQNLAETSTATAPIDQNQNLPLQAIGQNLGSHSSASLSGSASGGAANASSSSAASVTLSASDIALISHSMTASFDAAIKTNISGMTYTQGASPSVAATSPHQGVFSMHSLRWKTDEGINNSNVTFSAQAGVGSAAGSVQFQLHFKIQDATMNETAADLNLVPASVNITNQTHAGHTYKTYQFTFADASVRGSDYLKQLKLTLVYQMPSSGLSASSGTLSAADSDFSFVRENFLSISDPWNSGSLPVASSHPGSTIIAPDSFEYVVHLQ